MSFSSLTELADLLREGRTSSVEIVEGLLARIDAHDGKLHAFVDLYREAALACAHAADLEREAGFSRGPLHGLPIALKDLLHIEGRQTTAGSRSWVGRLADHTATAVERLHAAGMIILGKTHMVEFAFGTWGRNLPMGAPWNPWDMRTHRVAGGSSSGAAVAVAAGLAPAAIGSDTGGSVRIPASLCGLTGLKPTYGRISLHGVVPLARTLDSIGPLTRSVEDAALLTSVMAGYDHRDPATHAAPTWNASAGLREDYSLRDVHISALAAGHFPAYLEAEVLLTYNKSIASLRELGARVEEASLPFDFQQLAVRNGKITAAESYAVHRAYIEDASLDIDPEVRKRTLGGKSISASDYLDEIDARRHAAAEFAAWMRGRDVLLTPTLPITATPLADVDEATTPLGLFTRPVNYLGGCALTLPAGVSANGLPIGVQLIAGPFNESMLVRIGCAFQHHTDWHRRYPM